MVIKSTNCKLKKIVLIISQRKINVPSEKCLQRTLIQRTLILIRLKNGKMIKICKLTSKMTSHHTNRTIVRGITNIKSNAVTIQNSKPLLKTRRNSIARRKDVKIKIKKSLINKFQKGTTIAHMILVKVLVIIIKIVSNLKIRSMLLITISSLRLVIPKIPSS